MNNVVNQVAYLQTSRDYPEDQRQLLVEINKSWVDSANAINARVIGIFSTNKPAITGESWFIKNQRQQTLRQVYSFGKIDPGTELDIPTGVTNFTQFTRIYGTVVTTNGSSNKPDYRPLPYVDPASLPTSMTVLVGQVHFPTPADPLVQCIRIVLGNSAPPVTQGIVVLEWLSKV